MSATAPSVAPATSLHNAFPETALAYVNQAAIAHNLQSLRHTLNSAGKKNTPSIWAVVKADAYGHGVMHVLPGLHGADGIAVLSIPEAYALRSLGWHKPILVMSAQFSAVDLRDPKLFPLHLVIDNERQIVELERLRQADRPFAWLRYSGILHHAGFDGQGYGPACGRLQKLLRTDVLSGFGHMQHYAQAEDAEQLRAERKIFEALFAALPGPRCTENSAALLSDPGYAAGADWVRSGIALYGISPLHDVTGSGLGLMPAMTLRAAIHRVQKLPAGQPLGYGATFRTSYDMRIGLVACGYADGYPRGISENCPVLIDGRKSRILGRVSMDTITVDLSAHPTAGPGTIVTLWGADDLPVEMIARSAGTIPAQLCTGLTARVPRLAIDAPGGVRKP
ncbi:alanine racemase [Paralcaligenes ureilyticus]|uniref:Alanine racemase n=1 Tax=Paralcaligenes ureilyticus TaxID=627131 RepID=A0A4R3LPV4_9BURK|nr:alanine racemase [Paralcaligenes ureilyticus]TCT02523.1 alanine racemase [Paralcaligenes ureilyticus]